MAFLRTIYINTLTSTRTIGLYGQFFYVQQMVDFEVKMSTHLMQTLLTFLFSKYSKLPKKEFLVRVTIFKDN